MSSNENNVILWTSTDGQSQGTTKFDGTTVINANAFSTPILVNARDGIGLQVSAPSTGSPNGSFALQVSNDKPASELSAIPDKLLANWSTVSFWDETTGAWAQSKAFVGAQSYMVTIPLISARWIRFVWTNTSGTANLTVRAQFKSDGGR